MYSEMDTAEGDTNVYWLAKSRDKASKQNVW